MDERNFYATAMKSGKRLQIGISNNAIRVLEIVPGDELEVTVRKTGQKGRTNSTAFKPKKSLSEPEKPSAQVQVPEHIIEKVQAAKAKGMKIDQLKSVFNKTTEYSWEDLPELTRKELETE